MPVFYKHLEFCLLIVADGDYTPGEMRRVGKAALEDPETQKPARVLLDMSGAASLRNHRPADLRETARFFAQLVEMVDRVAVLATDDLSFGLMRMAAAFGEANGLKVEVFREKDTALASLVAPPGSEGKRRESGILEDREGPPAT
ncbi:MAG: hypothetical protein ACE5GJ_14385 [Gemmatimonadota bacterium]